jgi:hypothetical protein
LACIDDHAVNLHKPRERVIVEQLTSAELDVRTGLEAERITYSLGLGGNRALRHAEQLAQAVGR